MIFTVITIFPEMIEAFSAQGVLAQASQKGLLEVRTMNPRNFTSDLHRTVDDRPFGGGDGMVMLASPLLQAVKALDKEISGRARTVYLSPQGARLSQQKVIELAQYDRLTLICGRYAGVDQRFLNSCVDEEISIGDYVLSGGELAAGVVIDSVSRQIPGVLGHVESASFDSFSSGTAGLLEGPSYTRPRDFDGQSVPEILLSGHHSKISEWKRKVSVLTTALKRPDLLKLATFSDSEVRDIKKFWKGLGTSEKEVLGLSALSDSALELITSNGKQT